MRRFIPTNSSAVFFALLMIAQGIIRSMGSGFNTTYALFFAAAAIALVNPIYSKFGRSRVQAIMKSWTPGQPAPLRLFSWFSYTIAGILMFVLITALTTSDTLNSFDIGVMLGIAFLFTLAAAKVPAVQAGIEHKQSNPTASTFSIS